MSHAPRPEFDWSGPPQIPRNATVVIREALLPILMWTSVPVIRQIDQALTVVERFMVEAALALAPVRAEDVSEVTSIPEDAVRRIAGRLTGLGVLRTDGNDYYAVADKAYRALERRVIPEYRVIQITLLYLPDGDDLIAYMPKPGHSDPPLLHRCESIAGQPVTAELADRPVAELLRERMRNGRVAGLPDDIVDAADHDLVIPPVCPVYRCRGHVRSRGNSDLILSIDGHSGKRVRCIIPGAVGQADRWSAVVERVPDATAAWTLDGGMTAAVRDDPARWTFTLNGVAAAMAAGSGVTLCRPTGLSISDPSRCVVTVVATFQPADDDARRVFALDHAVRQVADTDVARIGADAPAAAAARARRKYALPKDSLTVSDVLERLWDDGHFRHVYALREAEDFAYD